jgi:hypothetical protein
MVVVDTATLSGTLNIVLADGFVPVYGDSFVIVDHGSRVGEFSALSGLDIGGGLLFNIAYRPDYVVIAAGDFLPPATWIISASGGADGSISPEGQVYVPDHGGVTFAINPDPGFDVGDVLVDDLSVGPAALYHFGDVTADHTIEAYFTPGDFSYEQLDLQSTTDMNGVSYGDSLYGVVVGDGGEIRITEDGGLTWWVAEHGVTTDLQDVQVLGETIFVVGDSGTVCISYDGGVTWVMSPTGVTEVLNAIELAHSAYGYAVGTNGTLLCWDGTGDWIPQTVPGLPGGSNLTDVVIVDGIVYVVGSNGLVISRETPDADWVILWSGQAFNFQAVSFQNTTTGYAVGSGGNVWFTSNGGVTWTGVDVGTGVDLHDCQYLADGTVWIIGSSKFIRTIDGGLNWQEVQFPHSEGFQTLAVAQCQGVVTGIQSLAYRFWTDGCAEVPGTIQGFVRYEGTGQDGVTVNLRDADGLVLTSMPTNSTGYFQFTELPPLLYTVEMIPPSGMDAVITSVDVPVRPGSTAMVNFELQIASAVGDDLLPVKLLCGAYPNPFNPRTTIHFELPQASMVSLEIFDIAGRRLIQLIHEQKYSAGRYSMVWNGVDGRGNRLSSGIYHYRLRAGREKRHGKITLLK